MSEQVVTLTSYSFNARLKDSRFLTAFNALAERYMPEQVVMLTSDSVTARLEDPSFATAFKVWPRGSRPSK